MDAVSAATGGQGAEILARAFGLTIASAAVEAFELSGIAVVLFNHVGEVIRLSRQAESLLGSGVSIVNKRLVAEDAQSDDELGRALNAVIFTDGSNPMPVVRLPRVGRLPLFAHPLHLPSVAVNLHAECRALVMLADSERRVRPPEEALCSAFNLTVAEGRLASRVAAGEAIEGASQALGIAAGTARNQLKAIFAKTGVRRQPELVALLTALFSQLFGSV